MSDATNSSTEPRLTPLHEVHVAKGGRMVPFAGWSMPVQFKGVIDEHQAVRNAAGIFDISHMGQFWMRGEGIAAYLDSRLTNHAAALKDGEGQYTLLLNESGGVLDDLIIYRVTEKEWFLVVNASRVPEDFAALSTGLPETITLENTHGLTAGFAVQGPRSTEIWSRIFPATQIPSRNGILVLPAGELPAAVVCRTGYTGEDGFEFFCSAEDAVSWYGRLLSAVEEVGGQAAGLGARDSLRLEMAYPLYGNDLDEDHTPIQAGLGFFVNLTKGPFTGSEVLKKQKEEGPEVKLCALTLDGPGAPPRHGYPVALESTHVGVVTSGGHSPSLGKGIALAYIPASSSKPGTKLNIEVRGRLLPVTVVKKPFYKQK